jgi:hypothetical protein
LKLRKIFSTSKKALAQSDLRHSVNTTLVSLMDKKKDLEGKKKNCILIQHFGGLGILITFVNTFH